MHASFRLGFTVPCDCNALGKTEAYLDLDDFVPRCSPSKCPECGAPVAIQILSENLVPLTPAEIRGLFTRAGVTVRISDAPDIV